MRRAIAIGFDVLPVVCGGCRGPGSYCGSANNDAFQARSMLPPGQALEHQVNRRPAPPHW